MDEGDPNHPYAGKRGRHPRDCNCPTCARKHTAQIEPQGDADAPTSGSPPPSPEPSSASASPPSLESLLSEGETKDNIVPPLDPKKAAQKAKDGGVAPKKAKKFYVNHRLFKFIGNKLAKITGVDGYKLDDDEAKDIAECLQDVGREKGWGFSSEMSLYLLLFLWLVIPTLEWAKKKWDEKKKEKEKEKEKLTDKPFGIAPTPLPEIIPDPQDEKVSFAGLASK